jgi:hypothetical protein
LFGDFRLVELQFWIPFQRLGHERFLRGRVRAGRLRSRLLARDERMGERHQDGTDSQGPTCNQISSSFHKRAF